MKYVLIDCSNILHKTFYVSTKQNAEDELLIPLAYNNTLLTLNSYYKKYKPDKIIFVFDRGNWRVEYTNSKECHSKRGYKAHRRQNMTPKQLAQYEQFKLFINDFEQLIRTHTSIICLAGNLLEADDLIAGFCKNYQSDDVVIVSSDKDLIQLLRYKNVTLIDPGTGNKRTLDQWDGDPDYFMFEKCFTGDRGDNVQSAYPRLRKTKIKEAYHDPYKLTNLFAETWTNQDNEIMSVKKLFDENKLLMCLDSQPDNIKEIINSSINEAMSNPGKYNHFHFLRFVGKYKLKNVSKNIDYYIPLLSH